MNDNDNKTLAVDDASVSLSRLVAVASIITNIKVETSASTSSSECDDVDLIIIPVGLAKNHNNNINVNNSTNILSSSSSSSIVTQPNKESNNSHRRERSWSSSASSSSTMTFISSSSMSPPSPNISYDDDDDEGDGSIISAENKNNNDEEKEKEKGVLVNTDETDVTQWSCCCCCSSHIDDDDADDDRQQDQQRRRRLRVIGTTIFCKFIFIVCMFGFIYFMIEMTTHTNEHGRLSFLSSSSDNIDGLLPVPIILQGSPFNNDNNSNSKGKQTYEMKQERYYHPSSTSSSSSSFSLSSSRNENNEIDDASSILADEQLNYLMDILYPILSGVIIEDHDNSPNTNTNTNGGDYNAISLQDYITNKKLIEDVDDGSGDVVKGSSQHKALLWLSSHSTNAITCSNQKQRDNSANINNNGNGNKENYYYYDCISFLSRPQLINRYVLATIYFAWNGKYWSDSNNSNISNNWLLPSTSSYSDSNSNEKLSSPLLKILISDICNWKGVTCRLQQNTTILDNDDLFDDDGDKEIDNDGNNNSNNNNFDDEQIIGLDLSNNNLIGIIGDVKNEIQLLQDLEILNLSQNHLKGVISNTFFSLGGGLRSLHTLQLFSNELSGLSSIISSTGTISNLKILQLEDNHITNGLDDDATNARCHNLLAAPSSSMNATSIVGMWRTGSTETSTAGNNTTTTTTNTENALPLLLAAPAAFERFSSDCAGTKPKVVCPCCTVCCGSASTSTSGSVGGGDGGGGNSIRGSSANSSSKKKEEMETIFCTEQQQQPTP
jgi:hypothetical protein